MTYMHHIRVFRRYSVNNWKFDPFSHLKSEYIWVFMYILTIHLDVRCNTCKSRYFDHYLCKVWALLTVRYSLALGWTFLGVWWSDAGSGCCWWLLSEIWRDWWHPGQSAVCGAGHRHKSVRSGLRQVSFSPPATIFTHLYFIHSRLTYYCMQWMLKSGSGG